MNYSGIDNIDWNFSNSVKKDSIHPYPAKFIPEIPRNLIQQLGLPKNTTIFDPFCGSGTTLVEAQYANYESVGVDLNPIACLISRVKTSGISRELVYYGKKVLENNCKNLDVNIDFPNIDHWFKEDIQLKIYTCLNNIEKIEHDSIKNALKMALSSIIVKVSRQESDTRYAAIEKDVDSKDFDKYFSLAVLNIVKFADQLNFSKPKSTILHEDILNVTANDFEKPVGLVITSPPYPNAYEYWLYHKYRIYWLGFDANEVKQKEIGARAHYFKKNHQTIDDFINQMTKTLELISEVAVKNANICFVIGRSKIHGKIYDNSEILINISADLNLNLVKRIRRQISSTRKSFNLSHAKIKNEEILIFRKWKNGRIIFS